VSVVASSVSSSGSSSPSLIWDDLENSDDDM
jgi:hypothetical protein